MQLLKEEVKMLLMGVSILAGNQDVVHVDKSKV